MQSINKLKQKTYKLLRWSEKYTKTDMLYLAKGGFWLTLGQLASSVSVFLLAVAFANLLPKETYGVYKYVLSIASLLAIPTLSGMNTAIAQAVARDFEGSFKAALQTKIRWGLLGSIAGLILSAYYYTNGNNTLTISFLIVSVFIPLFDSFNIYGSLLHGKKLFDLLTKYNMVTQLLSIMFVITAIIFTDNLFLILLTYFISWTFFRYAFFKFTIKKLPPNENVDTSTISYGKHLSLMNVLPLVAQQIDKVLVFHYLGAIELAIYLFAIAIPDQIKGFIKNIAVIAFPKFSQKTISEIKATIFIKILKLSIVLLVVVLCYIIIAPYIYKFLFPQYIESIYYSQIFSISLLASILFIPLSILRSQIAKKYLYFYTISSSTIQIILLFVFIYFMGILGAIIAGVLNRFIALAISLILVKKLQ